MEMLKTNSFELAVNKLGDGTAERMVLCLPGRLDTKDYAHIQSHMENLADHGFLTVSFDPPGTWESGGDISLYTTQNYLQAIHELIAHFGNRPTITLGHSRGGTMAMLAAVYNEYVTHAIAVMSHWGPSSMPPKTDEAVHVSHRDVPPGATRTEEQVAFELPMSYFTDDTTEYKGLDTCTKPKLFFAGTRDVLVSVEDVQAMYDQAADPKQMVLLDSSHDYRRYPEVIAEVNRYVGDFLQNN